MSSLILFYCNGAGLRHIPGFLIIKNKKIFMQTVFSFVFFLFLFIHSLNKHTQTKTYARALIENIGRYQ